ncbi:NAD(P)H-dependent oxidoreductase [Phycicoccus endophyticus]|uniref:NAD(P)H-dependent oxidoreductase n=1 Tax=Phycicoccus endophyticus TaxID=1690220 RepID=A0A7G9R1C5_9MICO|nr:NAD(P)H-dependent oxidoreductase [Phycicoccus endophyticus]NHI18818.1 NAD(P)H-dependent oxidoreductase [Phycicoccus endophyticus]QNN49400.1 NAD(P)H-dependent oxidoreductase [Phycicoccus endophyticus]GGL36321.1 putative NADPH-dependent FMN reductase [Phycicoccus endophyticus]
MNVLVLVGSLRPGSTNRQLADAAVAHLPAGVGTTLFERLAELPHYSEELDHDDTLPEVARDLRDAVADHDAILLVTPEYNGSLPSSLKNAVDWASRPRGASVIAGVPAAVLGASGSPRAAQWAREDGVRILTVAGARVLPDTIGVGSAFQAFEEGRLTDAELDTALRDLVQRLAREAEAAHSAA